MTLSIRSCLHARASRSAPRVRAGAARGRAFAGLAAALLCGRSGDAEPLAWVGRLDFEFLWLDPIQIAGAGVATPNDGATGVAPERLRLAGGLRGSGHAVDRLFLLPPITRALWLSAELGTGSLSLRPAGSASAPLSARERLPIRGLERLCYFSTSCYAFLPVALATPVAQQGLGLGGLVTVGDWTTLRLSVFGAPWTVATATLPVETSGGAGFELLARGSAHGPFSLTQSTALPGGAVSFVTPMRIASNHTRALEGFARLRIHFVPEPASPLLLGSGALGLASLGTRRLRPGRRRGGRS